MFTNLTLLKQFVIFCCAIGIPLDNTVLYLLDPDLRIVNAGEIGELYVSGKHLAAGYVNGRDAFRFLESPHTVDPGSYLFINTFFHFKISYATIQKKYVDFEEIVEFKFSWEISVLVFGVRKSGFYKLFFM